MGAFFLVHAGAEGEAAEVLGVEVHADEEGVEGVGAVGAELEFVLLGFGEFLAGFVLGKAVAVYHYAGLPQGKQQGFVVVFVEHGKQVLLPFEGLVNHDVFFAVFERVSDVDALDAPAIFEELIADNGGEVFVADGIVAPQGGIIVVVDDVAGGVVAVVFAAVIDQLAEFALVFDVKGFKDAHFCSLLLPGDEPVYVCIVVEGDAEGLAGVKVAILPAVHFAGFGEVVVEAVQVAVVKGSVGVQRFVQGGVEAVEEAGDAPAKDGGLEDEWREVAFHLPDVLFAQYLNVFNGTPFAVVGGNGTKFGKLAAVFPDEFVGVGGGRILFQQPNFIDERLDGFNKVRVHEFAVAEEP